LKARTSRGLAWPRPLQRRTAFSLRLPHSIKAEVERLATQDGISINQFVATAVAEKLSAMRAAEFFAERRDRADLAAFDRLMQRQGGEPPGPDHTIDRQVPEIPGRDQSPSKIASGSSAETT
jgi:hypothetical protein